MQTYPKVCLHGLNLYSYRTQENFGREKLTNCEQFATKIFLTDTTKMYLTYYVLILVYSPNFSYGFAKISPAIIFLCMHGKLHGLAVVMILVLNNHRLFTLVLL